VTWDELASGATIADFRLDNVPARVATVGDLWAPVCADARRGRFDLDALAR
jgi:DNA primase